MYGFSSVLSFLLSTHSVDCAVPRLLSIHMLIVPLPFSSVHRANCALFLQFTALSANFDGPFTALSFDIL